MRDAVGRAFVMKIAIDLRRKNLVFFIMLLALAPLGSYVRVVVGELYSGDFIVEAGQTRTIEDVTLTIDGNIIVKESAKLIVRNADLTVKSIAKDYYAIWLHENSIVEVENSRLREGPIPGLSSWRGIILGETGFRYYGSLSEMGKVIMRNTMSDLPLGVNAIVESSVLPIIGWEPVSQIEVRDSQIAIMDLRFWGKPETITITGLRKGEINVEGEVVEQKTPRFSFSSAEGGYLELENTLVRTWNLNMHTFPGGLVNEKHLIIKDSEIHTLYPSFPPGSSVHLKDLNVGIPMDWNLHRDSLEISGVPFDITLINTTVERYKIEIHGEGVVENSRRVFLNTYGDGTATVKNSTVDSSFFRGGHITYLDSYLTGWIRFMHWVPPGVPLAIPNEVTIHFENCTLADGGLEFDSEDNVTITGTISISIPMSNVNFVSGIVVREYPLLVEDEEGTPVSEASLNLKDAQNRQVWSGETDQAGRAAFNLTFTNENYARSYTLSATAYGKNVSTEIGFLASTPIILTLHKLASSISLSVSRENVRQGDMIAISGSVNPPLAEVAITVSVERPDGSTFNETILTDFGGSFNYTFIPGDAGEWSVHASWLGDEKYEGASSSSFSFIVEVPIKPLSWELYATIPAVVVATIAIAAMVRKKRRASSAR